MLSRRLTLIAFMTLTAGLTSSCGHQASVRIAQIPLRPELRECIALQAIQPEQWRAPAANPNLGAVFDAAGVERPRAAVLELLERAAGDHARGEQIQEQGFTASRDLAQASVGREMCNRHGEIVSLVDENNAGPER